MVGALARHGGLSPAERHDALKGIDRLRAQLREAELTKDHSLLDRLLRRIVKIAVLLGVVIGAAPLAALVAMAPQRAADGVRQYHTDPDTALSCSACRAT